MSFKYETHLHTAETSKCGKSSGKDFARHFKALGYTGVFATDHFLNGNTTVPDDLKWAERIDLFCQGYEITATEGSRIGLDVFFGWEFSFGWAHYLTYGLGKDWLLANPDLLNWDIIEYFDRVHADGGGIVHAHPFREKVDIIQLIPSKTDAVEILNPGRPDDCNRHAYDYARSFDLPATAGSDIHSTRQKRLCGVTCSQRFKDARDYITAIHSGDAVIFDDVPSPEPNAP